MNRDGECPLDAALVGLHCDDDDLKPAVRLELFVPSFQKTTGSILSEVQWTITFLIVLQTWLSPLQGFLIERLGLKS